ncbi:MAG: amino acid permease [Gammaproteobacteria bacterium RIFCSPHIGHO2_12_FULL_35_23]|nr:MAG: amino acid permease [Gammaproteobacteria bacterium RIFCSPHIGHO2_12_FULL_35_23]
MLSRRLTPMHMLFLSINGIIGSAWLFAPLYAAKIAGSAVILSWLIGGIATIIIAFTFAELSSMLPIAGGTTRFAQLSQGTTTGFVISWVSWLSCVTMPPIEVQAVLQYLSTYVPSLIHIVNQVPILTYFGLICATLLMLVLSIINIASFRGFVGFNFIIFFFKILVIVLTIIMLIKTRFTFSNFAGIHFDTSIKQWEAILSAVATGGIAFAFTGFKHGVELAGETTNPKISVPLSIVGSVVACLILYLGLQIAFIGSIDPKSLVNGWQQLDFSHEAGPFVGIAILLGLGWLVKLLLIDAAISPLGAGLIYVTSTARIIYAMSVNHYLSPILSRVNKNHFPVWAIFFNFVVGMFLFLPLPGWQNMVSFLVSAVVISYAMGPLALISLRKQLPEAKRPIRLPFIHFTCLVAFYFCNLISYWTGWSTMWKLAIAMLIGLVVYFIAIKKRQTDKKELGLQALIWLIPYLSGLVLISYLGSYGGKNIITFGWDFLIIALFTLVIYCLALKFRLSEAATRQQFDHYKNERLLSNDLVAESLL